MAESGTMRQFQLVGVPYTSMAESGGIANAISVFRGLDLAQRLAQLGVEDEGDMTLKGPSGVRGPSGLLNEEALDHLVERTHATVHSIRDRGRIPLMVGGDCPVLLGALASIGPGTGPGLVMLDGHEDAWPPSLSETGEASDSELGIALGLISDLSPTLAAWTPLVAGPRVALLGPVTPTRSPNVAGRRSPRTLRCFSTIGALRRAGRSAPRSRPSNDRGR
jgi:arginase